MIYISLLAIITAVGIYLYNKNKIKRLKIELQKIQEDFQKERGEIRIDAKKRSGAVQWGKTIEHFVPFLDEFPVPVEDCQFLGMPIDYVAFSNTASKTKCSVHFVEVKSGSAFLMGKQKNIKKAIQEGRVYWHEITVDGNTMK